MMFLWVLCIVFFKSERKTETRACGEPLFMWDEQIFLKFYTVEDKQKSYVVTNFKNFQESIWCLF